MPLLLEKNNECYTSGPVLVLGGALVDDERVELVDVALEQQVAGEHVAALSAGGVRKTRYLRVAVRRGAVQRDVVEGAALSVALEAAVVPRRHVVARHVHDQVLAQVELLVAVLAAQVGHLGVRLLVVAQRRHRHERLVAHPALQILKQNCFYLLSLNIWLTC
jgi:hypothetical protein